MFHKIEGELEEIGWVCYISNNLIGVQVQYAGKQKKWVYFLFPLIDDHTKSIQYFARDDHEGKALFVQMNKINGIGPKTAFQLSNSDITLLQEAVETMNVWFFQRIPGVWPKTAKRLIVELKSVVKKEDFVALWEHNKTTQKIITYCKWLWYHADSIQTRLKEYTWPITPETMSTVIARLVKRL